jgi:transcriptional regulator GlxA family with amidase domain
VSTPDATTGRPTRSVGILIFDRVEVLDFCGPFEVFSVAALVSSGSFRVFTIGQTGETVSASGGLSVNPAYSWSDAPAIDLLLIPGGQGTRPLMHDEATLDWIRERSATDELVLSVCTGALLLAKAGLLDGLSATTHHGAIDLLRASAPKTTVLDEARFVDNGRVITAAGVASGIHMSLHVVERLLGREMAESTARHIEFPWQAAAV